ncbi:MAG: hypothetical protein II998_06850 [Clostridia bacterium]|nr:hypothetical protein [Clostridia bacterium]
MIEIKRCENPDVLNEFSIVPNDGTVIMAACEKEEYFGVGVATINGNYSVLEKIEMKDEYKMFDMDFGMGKSVLNMLDLAGIRYVFSNIEDERLMTALRFKKDADIPEDVRPDKAYKYFLCLDGYFTVHKCDGE